MASGTLNHVQQVSNRRALRFHLTTAADFAAFASAIANDVAKMEFSENADLAEE
jgi:hypothetical protein